ncbi:HdeD family acid-resistance protein [Rathayibacter soli]|uniref:HdeD family acid-resistance protein n=1 Tax=Rathayibacter soli TaxID=3144168 RepID=UPI0027E55CEC|nr:DUF308 domain-containing protein [Glaciibacter superstes]
MMTATDPLSSASHDFAIDPTKLAKSAINGIRVAFGIGGVVALILGILLLVWPDKSLGAVAIILGIYFLISGVVRLALGIFSKGISGGMRTLDILLGILLIIAGVIVLKNVAVSAAALVILVVAVIGVGWIIEGVLSIVESRGAPSAGWAITSGIISIIAGIVVLVVPGWSAVWLIIVTGIVLVVLGIVGIVRAFTFGREVLKAAA